MVDVALKVDEGRFLFENAVFVALGHSVDDFVLVGAALADVHVIADADDVSHEGNHVGCFTDCFAVGYLALAFVQILDFEAQEVAGRSEGETRTRGVVAEQGDAETAFKYFCGDVVFAHVAESVGYGPDGFQFVGCLFPGEEEIAFVHFFEVEGIQFIDVGL